MLAEIIHGHVDLADVLFMVAFILFAVVFVLKLLAVALPAKLDLLVAGLACLALAWWVL